MTATERDQCIAKHRQTALEYECQALNLTDTLTTAPVNSEQYRRLNQRVGVSLKLADVHANLALAIAQNRPDEQRGDVINVSLEADDSAFVEAIEALRKRGQAAVRQGLGA